MVDELIGTFGGRWYVTAFGVIFLVVAIRHLGVKRTLIYATVALGVGVLAENGAVHFGIPYTRYSFNPDLRGHELWAGDVPLMVPMSYTFMAYFAFAAARLVVGGPSSSRSRMPVLEYVMAVLLATWALWIIDPVSRLGRFFLLGDLFQYHGPGFWFGLPLGSQSGFLCTSVILVGILTWMMRNEPAAAVPRLRSHPHLPALITYLAQVGFMTGAAFVIARTAADPTVATVADTVAGAAFIIGIPLGVMTAIHWRSLPSFDDAQHHLGAESGRSAVEST